MARETNKLTAAKVSRLKTPGRYGDGLGLWLQVTQSGDSVTKSWLFRYMINGRARTMGVGALHTVSLAEARVRARQARQAILDGRDPIEVRREERDEQRANAHKSMTFKEATEKFLGAHEAGWRNDKHKRQWRNTLKAYAYPTLATRPISAIDSALVNEAVAPIWTRKPETARRTKQRIGRVVQWVHEGMPLPSQSANRRVQHHAAMPVADLPAFMAELRERNSVSARALEFTILTAARTGETLGAKRDEIDIETGIWKVPAERMKGCKEHQVPLSERALELVEDLPRERGGYLFPGARAKQPLSNMAMLELLRGMRGNGLTVHGFRSAFRDWAGDRTNFPREVVEHALAHKLPDRVEAAYRRSTALEKRRKLMEAWARYCASPVRSADVVELWAS
jgi:integrase